MVSSLTFFAILSLAFNALAEPIPIITSTESQKHHPTGVNHVGADKAKETKAPEAGLNAEGGNGISSPPHLLTITVINSHTKAITTEHSREPSAPSAVSGDIEPGTLAAGSTATFAVPTGWIGNVAMNEAGSEITGDDTLIEANFVVPASGGYKIAVADVDISYVNGFSLPATCSCGGKVVSGCNKALFELNTCSTPNESKECKNPIRSDMSATGAAEFFKPCEGAAWTYVNDGGADAWGFCQSGQISCCVGTKCPKNPRQPN